MAATAHLVLVAPDNEKFTVAEGELSSAHHPLRKPNAEYRSREHLTEREVERLIEGVKGNRYGHRDATMILIAFSMAYARQSSWTLGGIRSIWKTRSCTSVDSRMAVLPRTH